MHVENVSLTILGLITAKTVFVLIYHERQFQSCTKMKIGWDTDVHFSYCT